MRMRKMHTETHILEKKHRQKTKTRHRFKNAIKKVKHVTMKTKILMVIIKFVAFIGFIISYSFGLMYYYIRHYYELFLYAVYTLIVVFIWGFSDFICSSCKILIYLACIRALHYFNIESSLVLRYFLAN